MVEAKRKPMREVLSDYSSSSSSDNESDRRQNLKKREKVSAKSKKIRKGSKKEEGVVNFDDSDSDDQSVDYEKFKTPKVNVYKQKKRAFTVSIVVPSSIIDNA
jgi:hypothetical protein